MSRHVALVAPVYPVQRVIRTILVGVVVWGPTLTIAVPAVLEAAHGLSDAGVLPAGTVARLAAVGAAALAVEGVLARIIALPKVNAILTKMGAGTIPRRAARAEMVAAVKDTKAALAAISTPVRPTP